MSMWEKDTDGIIVRIAAVNGAAAEVVVIAGFKSIPAGHFQRFVQHLAAGCAKGLFRVLFVHNADATDAAHLGDVVDKLLAMGGGPLIHIVVQFFQSIKNPSFLIIWNTFRPVQSERGRKSAY